MYLNARQYVSNVFALYDSAVGCMKVLCCRSTRTLAALAALVCSLGNLKRVRIVIEIHRLFAS